MKNPPRKSLFILLLRLVTLWVISTGLLQASSGGPLSERQASYDVKYYSLDLDINPDTRTIGGTLMSTMKIVKAVDVIEMDLDDPFHIDSVLFSKAGVKPLMAGYARAGGKLSIKVPIAVAEGDMVSVTIAYHGTPRTGLNPPWDAGLVWRTTKSGKPWIGVSCEEEGADIWWPCKDHPSDEPDSVSLAFTVPNPLQAISNGKFVGSRDNGNNTSTYFWFVSTPINNYNVTFYAAEYSLIEEKYQSVSGKQIPFFFWVTPESYQTAVNYMNVFRNEFNYLESICGPFPFGVDKHGFAQAPYWGMEHQTIVAYGSNFSTSMFGYDYIHYHEMAHEWWGNLITARDWSDVWIHEGIATYTEALYVEHLYGREKFLQHMDRNRPADNHRRPLAPREPLTANQALSELNPYARGSWAMHTLRYHLGDEAFFRLLKRWAYPDSGDFDNTNGRLCRILSTDDMRSEAEKVTGTNLDTFWEVFFREAAYPVLKVVRDNEQTSFTWQTEKGIPLDVDIPVRVNGQYRVVEMTDGKGTAAIQLSDELLIDPERWILMAVPQITTGVKGASGKFDYMLEQNYPNPFNPATTISYSIAEAQSVELNVYDIAGRRISNLVNGYEEAGRHSVLFDAAGLPSGVYLYELKAGGYTGTNKMLMLK